MEDYEKEYEDFWKELLEVDGVIDMDKVKRELSDFSKLISNVSLVYEHITKGKVSKPLTTPSVVIALSDDELNNAIEEALQEQFGLGD